MTQEDMEFDADYAGQTTEDRGSAQSYMDPDREFPLEIRCCITGEETKHGFCRYPDPETGTMMVMSHESMLRFSRKGKSLTQKFELVLALRRKLEKSLAKAS